jgi:hypothetical protein
MYLILFQIIWFTSIPNFYEFISNRFETIASYYTKFGSKHFYKKLTKVSGERRYKTKTASVRNSSGEFITRLPINARVQKISCEPCLVNEASKKTDNKQTLFWQNGTSKWDICIYVLRHGDASGDIYARFHQRQFKINVY